MKNNLISKISDGLLRTLSLGGAAVILLASSVLGVQTSTPESVSQTATVTLAGNAENGKKLFATYNCWSCHGSLGRAGGAAPAISPSRRTAEQLIQYIRKPAGAMPAYTSKSITDREIADIAAFLRSILPGPAAKDIPLLNQLNQ